MQIGFTSTTFKRLSPEKILALGAKAGTDCIEWSDRHIPNPAQAKDMAARCTASGIACCSLGSYYHVGEGDATRWAQLCETAAALGAAFIRVWLGKRGSAQTVDEEYAALLAEAKQQLQTAADYGLTIAAEAHPGTYNDSCETSLRFLRELGEPDFATYFQSLYKDMPADLERLVQTYPYIRAAHVSFSEVRRNRRFLPKETDCVERVVRALRERDFQGPVLLEFCKRGNPKAFLQDMERLKRIKIEN